MKRLLIPALMVLASVVAFAQAPTPTAKLPESGEWGKNLIYVGFAYEPTDFVPEWGSYKGIAVDYSRYIGKHISGVADFDWAKNNVTNPNGIDPGQAHNSSDYNLRFGPRVDVFKPTKRIRPYGTVLLGAGHFTSVIPVDYPPTSFRQSNWFGFTWAIGGGVDVRVTHHFGVRGEWLHTREPWGTGITDQADWDRISAGGFWRF
ncbi:MAG TPA: outer membrane beta-barrel protein [Candidatus Koribacter sp.]|jgi:opacity protein-like surface antigen